MKKKLKIYDIIKKMNNFANPKLALKWDNVGLQVGDPNWEVKKILIALDATPKVIKYAIKIDANLIITHHPYLFKSIKNVINPEIIKLIENKIGIFSAHTNLDIAKNGVNETLAEILQLKNLENLANESGSSWKKLSVYIPSTYTENFTRYLSEAGAGLIGNYKGCSFHTNGTGNFIPQENSKPKIGKINTSEHVEETKIDFFYDSINHNSIISALLKNHPYETPVYFTQEIDQPSPNFGLGLIGEVSKEMNLEEFSTFVKNELNAPFVKLWTAGKEDLIVKKVALCSGSGSSLINKIGNRADVYVSGDFTYHTILDSKIPIIDVEHFYSEVPIVNKIANYLKDLNAEIHEFPFGENEYPSQLRLK